MSEHRRINSREAFDRLEKASARLGDGQTATFMEVCGTHTVSVFRSGLHSLLPENVRLLSGPGCPVCVTSQSDIDRLIMLAGVPGLTLCTYGDMLRVTGSDGTSLQDARARGADVRIVYTSLDAVDIAAAKPDQQVAFAAVGFETTAPATAVAVLEAKKRGLGNFSIYACHKQIMPAMHALLRDTRPGAKIDGFLLPGHVAIITGSEAFAPIVQEYRLPCVVSGFEGEQIAAALALLTEMAVDRRAELVNLYPQVVCTDGNRAAQQLLNSVFTTSDERWRGLGLLPASGLALQQQFRSFDAVTRFGLPRGEDREPHGCRCGEVITGRCTPADCKLFGTTCTPVKAIGPCMVSSEGTCAAWFRYRRNATASSKKSPVRNQPTTVTVGGEA